MIFTLHSILNDKLPYVLDPITDHKKKSKKGRLVLIKQDGEFQTVREEETNQEDEMFLVFENGELLKDWSLSEVRARAWSEKTKS